MSRRQVSGAVCVAVFLTACSGGASTVTTVNRQHGIPIRSGEIHGPGTPLLDGFTVPEGAVLAGAVLSAKETTGGPDGIPVRSWSAILGIDGPPLGVVRAFADQANSVGLQASGPPSCSTAEVVPHWPARCVFETMSPVTSTGSAGPHLTVRIDRVAGRMTSGFIQLMEFGGPDDRVPPTSSATLLPSRPSFERAPSISLPAQTSLARGRIPKPGEPIGFDIASLDVEAGSAMVVPVYGRPYESGEAEALLRVTGEPEDVFRKYLTAVKRGIASPRGQLDALKPRRSDGWNVRTVYFDDGHSDGRGGTAQLFTEPNRAYIRIYLYQG